MISNSKVILYLYTKLDLLLIFQRSLIKYMYKKKSHDHTAFLINEITSSRTFKRWTIQENWFKANEFHTFQSAQLILTMPWGYCDFLRGDWIVLLSSQLYWRGMKAALLLYCRGGRHLFYLHHRQLQIRKNPTVISY